MWPQFEAKADPATAWLHLNAQIIHVSEEVRSSLGSLIHSIRALTIANACAGPQCAPNVKSR
jgi:hypothetical protein